MSLYMWGMCGMSSGLPIYIIMWNVWDVFWSPYIYIIMWNVWVSSGVLYNLYGECVGCLLISLYILYG